MKNKLKCYSAVKGIDDVLAKQMGEDWTPGRVANLRGMWAERANTEDIPSAAQLAEFNVSLNKKDLQEYNKRISGIHKSTDAKIHLHLKKVFNASQREDYTNIIATMFSDIVDAEIEEEETRKQCIERLKVPTIFSRIYLDLLKRYNKDLASGNNRADELKKILTPDTWAALIFKSKGKLLLTEDLLFGRNIDYIAEASIANINDEDNSLKYTADEGTRESWQTKVDFESAFGSVSKQVRKILSRTPAYQRNEAGEYSPKRALGFALSQDPIKLHQELLDVLRGVGSEAEVLQVLKGYTKVTPWAADLLEELEASPETLTQFYTNFKKSFQPYSKQIVKLVGGVYKYTSKLLNKDNGDRAFNVFKTSFKLSTKKVTGNSIFRNDKNHTVIPIKVNAFKSLVNSWLTPQGGPLGPVKFWQRGVTQIERQMFIATALEALGIEIDGETVNKIMHDRNSSKIILKGLTNIAKFGLKLSNDEESGNQEVSYLNLMKRTTSTSEKGALTEHLTKILSSIVKHREGLKLESRVRHNGNTYFSDVIPSFLGDRMDDIATFVRAKDSKGLKAFLESEYLNSSYFRDSKGNILNKWLEELYNSDLTKEDSFAEQFIWKRHLAMGDIDFENFTSKKHLISLLNEYFAPKQISNSSNKAWYPVFVLGDAGVSKFIQANRYSKEEILESMYNVYIQEITRINTAKAVANKLSLEGFSPVTNFNTTNSDKFTLLPFLNEDFEGGIYHNMIDKDNLKESVTKAINAYMENRVNNFINQATKLEVLEQANGKYKHLDQEVRRGLKVEDILSDYFWNTKLATINQLQVMTIDPAFYKDTKDLQKRYKEIHAPGTAVSVDAVNPWTGELYSEDGIERCLYFEDLSVNAEETNPEFMKAIEANFGKSSSVYKTYLRNTLTDGQGYRTLGSYRKVMGMAGKWNRTMEEAYYRIKAIRSTITIDETPSYEQLKEIAELAVVFQPLKPYHYGFENYSLDGVNVQKIPVQHKYAEAVLITELLPPGKLRDLANYMENNDIDMACSTTVVKVGNFGAADISKVTNSDELTEALRIKNSDELAKGLKQGAYVHQLNYSNYRIQTNVPEHINAVQLFGTQVRKLIMAKLKLRIPGATYSKYVGGKTVNLGGNLGKVNLNGENLISFYNSLHVANILDSYNTFKDVMDDPERISELLVQTAANNTRESDDNILSYSLDDFQKFVVPLFEGSLEHDSAALLWSVFKKYVNKQAIKGGSAVQVSAMGITGYKEDENLKYITDPDNPSNIIGAECILPWDIDFTDSNGNKVSLEFEEYCHEDGTLKLDSEGNSLIEKDYPNILEIIAYRIPTERDYSMMDLKIVKFLPKEMGGVIMVPAQGTNIAGFDFDIDKLYLMRNEFTYKDISEKMLGKAWVDFYAAHPELYKELSDLKELNVPINKLLGDLGAKDVSNLNKLYMQKEGVQEQFSQWIAPRIAKYAELDVYDFNKPPIENSRSARNNMLIHLIKQRLRDPETFKERFTPGGFSNASKAAKKLRFLLFGKEKVRDLINTTSKTLNLNGLESLLKTEQDPEPNYDPSDPMTIITYNQQNSVASKLIGIFANQNTNHAFASLMRKFTLKKDSAILFGNIMTGPNYSGRGMDLLTNPNIDTSLTVAEFLAASVDAVKDPVLNYLNLNTVTADSGAILARLGYTTEDIGLLFNQPIIKDVCDYYFNSGMSDVNIAIAEVLNQYNTNSISETKALPTVEFTSERLAYNIVASQGRNKDELFKDSNFVNQQRHIIDLFKSINNVANEVSNFVINTKFTASNAVGSTYGDILTQQMRVTNYLETFSDTESLNIEMAVTENISTPINNNVVPDNDVEYMESTLENPFAYEQVMYDMTRRAYKKMSKLYPYNTPMYQQVREFASNLTKSNSLDAETINSIHSDLLVYTLSSQKDSIFDPESFSVKDQLKELGIPFNADGMNNRDVITKVLPKLVFKILENRPDLKESNALFQSLQFYTDEETEEVFMSLPDVGGLAPHQKEAIKEGWSDLARDRKLHELGTALFLYNFYNLGYEFSPRSFMNLCPTDVKTSLIIYYDENGDVSKSYIDFLDDILDGNVGINSVNFMQQYLLNHLDNRRLVYHPKGSAEKILTNPTGGLIYKDSMLVEEFILDTKKYGEKASSFVLKVDRKDGKTIMHFRPVIFIKGNAYMCDPSNKDFNATTGTSIKYVKVDALGRKGMALSYFPSGNIIEADRVSADSFTLDDKPAEEEVPSSDYKAAQKYVHENVSEVTKTPEAEELLDEIMEVVQNLKNTDVEKWQLLAQFIKSMVEKTTTAEDILEAIKGKDSIVIGSDGVIAC